LAYRGAPSPTPQERILTSLATKKRPPTSRCQWKHGRAVQFSLCDTVCQCVIEVERVYVEFAGYVFDAVGA
jgi:hypothetical protein